jgi:hypothetical protein
MNDDRIIQLAPDGLERVFRESMPKHPPLSGRAANVALMMHRAGRDAYAIAERIQAPLPSVLAFLDYLRRVEAAKAASRGTSTSEPAPERFDPLSDASVEDVAPPEEASEPPPAPDPPLPVPRDTRPDIELSELQQAIIRRLRKGRARVPAATIALVMRLSPDQVMRVSGEIP